MLNPLRLMTLAAVEERHGVVGAARSLHLTPSAVSQQLRQLEREAGVALLDRSGRQVRLTQAGRRLAQRGRGISQEVVLARDDLAQWSDAAERAVVMGAFQTVICQLVAPLMAAGAFDRAGLSVRVIQIEGAPGVAALNSGEIDMLMTEELLGDDVHRPSRPGSPVTRLVMDDRYRVVVPEAWQLERSTPAQQQADLIRRPWIAQVPASAGSAMLEDLQRRWGFSARIVHVCGEYTSAVALVSAGVGATLAPHLALPSDLSLGGGPGGAPEPSDLSSRPGKAAEPSDLSFGGGPGGAAEPSDLSSRPGKAAEPSDLGIGGLYGGGGGGLHLLEGTPDLGQRRVRALCRPSRRPNPRVEGVLGLLAERARAIGLEARLNPVT